MSSTIDSAGRLVIPKNVREQAHLEPGMPLSITVRDGVIEIEPKAREVTIVRKGRLSIALPTTGEDEALEVGVVEETRRRTRRDRER